MYWTRRARARYNYFRQEDGSEMGSRADTKVDSGFLLLDRLVKEANVSIH